MATKDLNLTDAKTTASNRWSTKAYKYDLSRTDGFTDGFWDGRAWAFARLLGMIPEDKRREAVELLGLYASEIEALDLPDDVIKSIR